MSDNGAKDSNNSVATPGLTHVGPAGPRMIDVGDKAVTRRRARAEATVRVGTELAEAIRTGGGRKGDILAVAQLAGIQAVKHTSAAIPLCHPLPIEGVDVVVRLVDGAVAIEAEVSTVSKTGVEMEALHAATVAALTVIDMGKSIERGLGIERVRLIEKVGGVRGDYHAEPSETGSSMKASELPTPKACKLGGSWPSLSAGVLTVSDRASSGVYADRGGPAIVAWLEKRLPDEPVDARIVPDDPDRIRGALDDWHTRWSSQPSDGRVGLILTTGGTGIGPRDCTPEVVTAMCDRPHPGLVELARARTGIRQPLAYLSRGVAGVTGRTLIITLPGSPRGAIEWLDALEPVLPHALDTLVPDEAEQGDEASS